jgi:nucleotide-binding universal stress UspA family protein
MAESLIVVGVDGSPGSSDALAWALGRAQQTGATVRAVMSWDYPPMAWGPHPVGITLPPAERMEQDCVEDLARAVAEVRPASTTVEVTQQIGRGPAAAVLLTQSTDADLLVVGSRGRGRLASVLLGSVSRRVAAEATCPVVVVPAGTAPDRSGRVVVGVDGSPASLAALEWAAGTGAPLEVVHALEHPYDPVYAETDAMWNEPEELGRRVVERLVADTVPGAGEVTRTIVRGDARQALIDAGRDAALVVVGARGATGLDGLLLGSVTTGVAGHTEAPVVVVPS